MLCDEYLVLSRLNYIFNIRLMVEVHSQVLEYKFLNVTSLRLDFVVSVDIFSKPKC